MPHLKISTRIFLFIAGVYLVFVAGFLAAKAYIVANTWDLIFSIIFAVAIMIQIRYYVFNNFEK